MEEEWHGVGGSLGDGERDQCVGNGNRRWFREESQRAGLGDMSELRPHIGITQGNFSLNVDMLGSPPDQMNWNLL